MQVSHANWILFDEINRELAAEFYKLIARTAAHNHLLILVDCNGGDPLVSAGLVQTIEHKFPVVETRVVGRAHSAAVDFLLCGGLRTALPTAEFITHATTEELSVSPANAAQAARLVTQQNEWILRRYVERCGRTLKFWRDFFAVERFFGAKEARRLKIVTQVL